MPLASPRSKAPMRSAQSARSSLAARRVEYAAPAIEPTPAKKAATTSGLRPTLGRWVARRIAVELAPAVEELLPHVGEPPLPGHLARDASSPGRSLGVAHVRSLGRTTLRK